LPLHWLVSLRRGFIEGRRRNSLIWQGCFRYRALISNTGSFISFGL
jgi:hypothetical protein